MIRIIARHADAYIAIWPIEPAQVTEQWQGVAAACADVGRDPATLELVVGTFVQLPETGGPTRDERSISGSYDEIAAKLQTFADAGVRHLIVDFRPDISGQAIQEFSRVLEILDQGDVAGNGAGQR